MVKARVAIFGRAEGQIICSCPITQFNAQGYQILGPYPCDKSFFRYCKGDRANSKTGSTIYVGAPIGTAQALAVLLNGQVPPINECGSKQKTARSREIVSGTRFM